MKRIIFVALLCLVVVLPTRTGAIGGFTIDSFMADIAVQADGTVSVTETIVADFTEQLHGIYRDIPVAYAKSDGSRQYTTVLVEDITDADGSHVPYETTLNRSYLRIKIGDADRYVVGQQTYIIHYSAHGVIGSFSDHDELYWNATGNAWEVPIRAASAKLSVVGTAPELTRCFVGSSGSTTPCVVQKDVRTATYTAGRSLAIGEGLTIVGTFAKGTVPILSVEEPLSLFTTKAFGYIGLGFLLLFIPAAFVLLRLWWLKGRDEYYQRKSLNDPLTTEIIRPLFGSYEPIVAEYDAPASLRPAEIGVLLDERADPEDISATVVDLAVRGYLKIEEVERQGILSSNSYRLIRTDKTAEDLLPYENLLLTKLFADSSSVLLSDLKEDFYTETEAVKQELYEEVTRKKLFAGNPEEVRSHYKLFAFILLIVIAVYVAVFYGTFLDPGAGHSIGYWIAFGTGVGAAVTAIALMALASQMPKRTAYGRDMYRQALGYKLFVSGTEKYRQPFFEKENIFMQVLPYAIVFGVTERLARAMQEMQIEPNVGSWYVGIHTFNMLTFSSAMTDLSASLSTSLATAPTSSGTSGFSGGGFGGGGGGGW